MLDGDVGESGRIARRLRSAAGSSSLGTKKQSRRLSGPSRLLASCAMSTPQQPLFRSFGLGAEKECPMPAAAAGPRSFGSSELRCMEQKSTSGYGPI